MSEAKVRFEANVAEINSLLAELQRNIEYRYASTSNPDYGDVGDLAYIRKRLNEALGRDGKDPPSKPKARR
jgi:hypothetical protein